MSTLLHPLKPHHSFLASSCRATNTTAVNELQYWRVVVILSAQSNLHSSPHRHEKVLRPPLPYHQVFGNKAKRFVGGQLRRLDARPMKIECQYINNGNKRLMKDFSQACGLLDEDYTALQPPHAIMNQLIW